MLLHLKRRALDDSSNQGREPEVMVLRVLNDLADRGHIVILEAASERVSQHFLRHDADENLPLADERLAQANDAVEGGAVEQRSRWIDPSAFVVRSPMANDVEVFQSEPDRVHRFVAARADGVLAMLLHAFPQRERLGAFRIFLQWRNVRWRRRWRYAQQVRQDPLSTFDWRCPVWIRRAPKRRNNVCGERRLIFRRCRPADEDLAPGSRIAGAGLSERAFYRDTIHRRIAGDIEAIDRGAHKWLDQIVANGIAPENCSRGDRVRAGLHRNADG